MTAIGQFKFYRTFYWLIFLIPMHFSILESNYAVSGSWVGKIQVKTCYFISKPRNKSKNESRNYVSGLILKIHRWLMRSVNILDAKKQYVFKYGQTKIYITVVWDTLKLKIFSSGFSKQAQLIYIGFVSKYLFILCVTHVKVSFLNDNTIYL